MLYAFASLVMLALLADPLEEASLKNLLEYYESKGPLVPDEGTENEGFLAVYSGKKNVEEYYDPDFLPPACLKQLAESIEQMLAQYGPPLDARISRIDPQFGTTVIVRYEHHLQEYAVSYGTHHDTYPAAKHTCEDKK